MSTTTQNISGYYTLQVALFISVCYCAYIYLRKETRSTELRGPPSQSWIFGVGRILLSAPDPAVLYDSWLAEYGAVYSVPMAFGSTKIMLHDPKAIAHFYAREGTGGYGKTTLAKMFIETLFGRNIIWAEGGSDMHGRHRKSLSPAFSNASIRNLTPLFYDTAYKMTLKWNALLETDDSASAVIDVQKWMNAIALDAIGIAGFSHEFRALDGVPSAFDQLNFSSGARKFALLLLLGGKFPGIAKRIPNERFAQMSLMRQDFNRIGNELFQKGKDGGLVNDKSVIGLLLRAENEEASFHLTPEEITAQMNVLMLAGYETTSISLTWCLIELCRQPDVQERLRDEILKFGASDPTYDQLLTALPYLDAVVHETLRTHPPVGESARVATKDDIIPLSAPIRTKSGEMVNSLFIAEGSLVSAPIRAMNLSEEMWGPDAKRFNPDRWLDEEAQRRNQVQGHRHILTFIDGPRTCLGKQFAIVEFMAVLAVLIKTYRFEFDDGKEFEIGKFTGLLPRPKDVSRDGCQVPLRVRHV